MGSNFKLANKLFQFEVPKHKTANEDQLDQGARARVRNTCLNCNLQIVYLKCFNPQLIEKSSDTCALLTTNIFKSYANPKCRSVSIMYFKLSVRLQTIPVILLT